MTTMNKRGLTTLFIFLGIVILAVMVALVTILSEDKPTQEQEQQILTRSEMQPIKDYIQSCLKLVSEEALDLIGRQGFALYTSQGGTIPGINPNERGQTYLNYDGDAVTYRISLTPENSIEDSGKLIISNSKTKSERFGDTTLLVYPWAAYPNDPFTGAHTTYLSSGYGWNTLPPLNRIGPNSIEAQLEGYINKRIPDCTNWNNYPEFSINAGVPSTQTIFANQNTIISAKWRVQLADTKGRQGVIEDFVISIPVRLATIHRLAKSIIDHDVSNITYDIASATSEIQVYKHYDPSGGSVIRLVDPLSTLNAKPYEARFARQNRPPALSRIDQDTLNTPTSDYLLSNCAGATITLSGNTFSVSTANTSCSANIALNLHAIDPDEEPVSYSAQGRLGIPYTITSDLLRSPSACIPYTLIASDGHDTDWQQINLRTKSINVVPQCI